MAQRYFQDSATGCRISYGPIKTNYYSFIFSIEQRSHGERQGIYVKIPKARIEKRQLLPTTDEDRLLAIEEYRSLLYLSKSWHADDLNVSFIKPLEFIPEHNAIVTQRVYGASAFRVLRRLDVLGRLSGDDWNDPMHKVMTRLGTALFRFHDSTGAKCVFRAAAILGKIERYCGELASLGLDRSLHERITKFLSTLNAIPDLTHQTLTLKGLDLRNMLVDRNMEHLFLLDPGRIKEDYREADLARFIATCRLAYWGTLPFFLHLSPRRSYEHSFLKGYYGSSDKPPRILIFHLIKELLKHWTIAHVALRIKQWPRPVAQAVKRNYIDPFFRAQISDELDAVAAQE